MMRRSAALLLLVATVVPVRVLAQAYPAATPAPRITSAGQVDALLRDRAVAERFRRGLAAQAQMDWAGAASEFRAAIALDPPEPANATAHYDLGIALAHLGRSADAADAFDEALRRDPGFAAAAANLTEVTLRMSDLPRARAAADRFLAIAPASLRARYSRGIVALRSGDLATARVDFQALTSAAPRYAVAHYDLAVTEMRSGAYDAAHVEIDLALAESPTYARARFARAVLLVRSGRTADAALDLQRVEDDADDPALRDLALRLREQVVDAHHETR